MLLEGTESHEGGSKNNFILYTIYPPKKNYFCIITLLNAWGLTGHRNFSVTWREMPLF